MKKIVIGGQIDKQKLFDITTSLVNGQAEVEVKGDIDAAMAVKSGTADLYLGACNTGGGGALAMAIALLGLNMCETVSMPGSVKSKEEIENAYDMGKRCFGFIPQDAESIIPIIINKFLND